MKYYLTVLALLPMAAGPTAAEVCLNGTCRPRVFKRAAVVVKKEVVVEPVAVFVPSYVATIAPYAVQTHAYVPPQPAVQTYSAAPVAYGAHQQVYQQTYQQRAVGVGVGIDCTPELAAALRAINERLCALEGKPVLRGGEAPQPPPNAALAPANGIPRAFAAKCAACHTLPNAKGSLALFDGKGGFAKLTDRQLRLIVTKSYGGEMPPKGNKEGVAPLTDEEVGEIVGWANGQK